MKHFTICSVIVADNYVVNSCLQHTVVKCVLWALRQGGKLVHRGYSG